MKKNLFCLLLVLLGCVACSEENTPKDETQKPVDTNYVGQLTVGEGDSNSFVLENVKSKVEYANDKMSILLEGVKFAENMPVSLNMTIPGIDYTTGDVINFWRTGIVPLAMGGEFPTYPITNLNGTITDGVMSFSMTCGDYPVMYTGTQE